MSRSRLTAADRAAAEKTSDWIAQGHQLQARSKGAHKNAAMALLAIRADNAEVPDAEESARKMSLSRKDEAAVLFAQLQAVKENVASLRSLIESRGTGPEYVDSLRNTMDSVENEIYSVRQGHHMAFVALSSEEEQLNRAVASMEAEIVQWLSSDAEGASSKGAGRPATAGARLGTSGAQYTPGKSKVAAMISQPQLPPEVVAVDRILREEGGSTGGWDDGDHERFLRYRTMFKGQPHVYCAKTAEDLIDHDVASVERHDLWYERYLKLLEEKKAAIRSWRTTKTSHTLTDQTQLDSSPSKRPDTAVEGRRRSAGEQMERERQKEQIRQWKEEKAREAAEAEEKKRDEEAALEAKKKKEAREREDAKRRLSNYKTAKELAQERRKAEEEHAKLVEKEKAKISADQLERIRTRNRTLTMEHMNLVRRKAEEERQRQQRVEALKDAVPGPDVDRDPSRLTALTAASVAKRDANMRRNGEEPERPGYFAIMRPTTIAHNPSRLVPSWRAGL